MSVMQDCAVSKAVLQRENSVHQRRVVPFVKNNDVCPAQLASQKLLEVPFSFVELNVEIGIRLLEVIDRVDGAFAFVADQIGQRPGTERLIASDLVSQVAKFAGESAQEMSVAVIPV